MTYETAQRTYDAMLPVDNEIDADQVRDQISADLHAMWFSDFQDKYGIARRMEREYANFGIACMGNDKGESWIVDAALECIVMLATGDEKRARQIADAFRETVIEMAEEESGR